MEEIKRIYGILGINLAPVVEAVNQGIQDQIAFENRNHLIAAITLSAILVWAYKS